MFVRSVALSVAILLMAGAGLAQTPNRWRSPLSLAMSPAENRPPATTSALGTPSATPSVVSADDYYTPASSGSGVLPNDRGQIWREYDISAYTTRVTSPRPEQAIVDWILRETGYEAWHSDTVAMLSASRGRLRVYHTPEMQQIVAEIVNRFTSHRSMRMAYAVQICTVGHPDWRARVQKLMRPVPVQSQGAAAWLLAKEDAAMLMNELGRRSDFRSHSSPNLLVNNGQKATVTIGRKRSYVRGLLPPTPGRIGMETDVASFNEGVTMEMNPLLSLDGSTIDATVKCSMEQLERLVPVRLEVPSALPAARQYYNVEVPQVVGWHLHERFRWPKDTVLLISMGMTPRPVAQIKSPLNLPLNKKESPRGEALIFVEARDAPLANVASPGSTPLQAQRSRGRY